ncbi:hypothetical protein [uncultured Deinococcus sp.]|uniref:hypothetical protein n=1 Tax=uncultured Deinococcus sp. TaxID=158789 RepID=UPI0025D26726|nr:hypothetical protein [uncultured Deinococcus sp.]
MSIAVRSLATALLITPLYACAPAMQATNTIDPVFAAGQVWNVGWGDATQDTLTVPALSESKRGTFSYTALTSTGARSSFWYDPMDSDPEFLHVYLTNVDPRWEKHCWVRMPGSVNIKQILQGVFSTTFTFKSFGYIKSGDTGGLSPCTLTRLQ